MRLFLAPFLLLALPAAAAEDFGAWPPHLPRFESTGGGGVVIDEYRPVRIGAHCVTRFTATLPDGRVFANYALFDARPVAGGTLCENGRFVPVEGGPGGTTPYRVLLRDDGAIRRSPPG